VLGVDVTVHELSVLGRFRPTNETVTPAEPYVGVSVREGGVVAVTVNTACAESLPLPESVIVYDPGIIADIRKVPTGAPLPNATLQAGV
jgi:hypothetical protein